MVKGEVENGWWFAKKNSTYMEEMCPSNFFPEARPGIQGAKSDREGGGDSLKGAL